MSASKHTIYLTKNYQLDENLDLPTNVFLFNENGPLVQARWIQKTLEQNDGLFVILDHNQTILKTTEKKLLKRNYYVENIDFRSEEPSVKINPFDLVTNTSEIHFLFLNMLYIMWDNEDSDLAAMSNLLDAFASCTYFMFQNQREKLNMLTLKKMVHSVRSTCQTNEGIVMLSDAIFAQISDQESMPCKYYAQFKKAAGERLNEVGEKLAKAFDMFSEYDLKMMMETEEDLKDEIGFKTALFLNIEKEEDKHSAKLLMTLLNYFVQTIETHPKSLFIVDDLSANNMMISLPYWMKEGQENNMSFIVCSNDLASFKDSNEAERFFKNLQKSLSASVLMHTSESSYKDDNLPTTNEAMGEYIKQDFIATVLIPEEQISDQDIVF